jgi:two-component system sensor histidine kinase VicK
VSLIRDRLPRVNIDAKRIRQVLDNIIDNAVKYSNEGSSVVIELIKDGEKLQVSVADEGIGIPAENLEKVFDRMYRLEQRLSTDPGGMGLGLALCKALVEAHDGQIWVASQVDEGSTFCFTIPMGTK